MFGNRTCAGPTTVGDCRGWEALDRCVQEHCQQLQAPWKHVWPGADSIRRISNTLDLKKTKSNKGHVASATGETWNMIQEIQFEKQICVSEGLFDASVFDFKIQLFWQTIIHFFRWMSLHWHHWNKWWVCGFLGGFYDEGKIQSELPESFKWILFGVCDRVIFDPEWVNATDQVSVSVSYMTDKAAGPQRECGRECVFNLSWPH